MTSFKRSLVIARFLRRSPLAPVWFVFLGELICWVLFIWRVPPTNDIVIALFVLYTTGMVWHVSSRLTRRKYQILGSLMTMLWMTITLFSGFNLLNTILLACFIIAISTIVPS